MSSNKYADLPDIDTAPDIYETEDIFPTHTKDGASSEDESGQPGRPGRLQTEFGNNEGLNFGSLMRPDEASKMFRKAEKQQLRTRMHYAYPPSPTSSTEDEPIPRTLPLSHRLRTLQAELTSLEAELADPSNPLIQREREERNVDPGELIRGLVDVRSRLDRIRKGKEGRARLVGAIMEQNLSTTANQAKAEVESPGTTNTHPRAGSQTLVDMDNRVSELEHVIGSSNTSLDESSPLPQPLLPSITRLQNQITILSQPRHIDAISRRLKVLLSDLERASNAQQQTHKRQTSHTNGVQQPPNIHDQILPILSRLGPLLPHIPHVLTRLRTLSALHTSAAEFQANIEDLEEEQKKMRSTLQELDSAVQTVAESLTANREIVKNNVAGLEGRVNGLLNRLDDPRHQVEQQL